MTAQTKARIRLWVTLAITLLPTVGWAIAAADSRYVHRSEYGAHLMLDSMRNAVTVHRGEYERHLLLDSIARSITQDKLDTLITRVEQIQCGVNIIKGCR